jgi:hypothetical protein
MADNDDPFEVPRLGDFDGDGLMDPTAYRPGTGQWFILYSSKSYNPGLRGLYFWGLAGDIALPTN